MKYHFCYDALTYGALGAESVVGTATRNIASGGVIRLVPALRSIRRIIRIRRTITPELLVSCRIEIEHTLATVVTLRQHGTTLVSDPVWQRAQRHLVVTR